MKRFYAIASSSSGNCEYIGSSDGTGLLIDAGVTTKTIEVALRSDGIDPAGVGALLLTHEHADHVKGVSVFTRRYQPELYASRGTFYALLNNRQISSACKINEIVAGRPFDVMGMTVTPIATSHDCSSGLSYRIDAGDYCSLGMLTDTGVVDGKMLDALRGVRMAVVEANFDPQMLAEGPYQPRLKARIRSPLGHLSNADCGKLCVELFRSGTRIFRLAHLSRTNNTPELALKTVRGALAAIGAGENEYELEALPPGRADGYMMF